MTPTHDEVAPLCSYTRIDVLKSEADLFHVHALPRHGGAEIKAEQKTIHVQVWSHAAVSQETEGGTTVSVGWDISWESRVGVRPHLWNSSPD